MARLREAQKEMTRKLLLDSGVELFVSKGYAATTVDDIASAAGTTRVTFYAYFPSKVDLMKALVSERLNAALDRVPSAEHGSTERELVAVVEDGSRERIRAWLAATSERWEAIRPYTTAAFEAAAVDPEIRALLEAWLNEAIGDIEDGLDRAGRFPPAPGASAASSRSPSWTMSRGTGPRGVGVSGATRCWTSSPKAGSARSAVTDPARASGPRGVEQELAQPGDEVVIAQMRVPDHVDAQPGQRERELLDA